MQTSIHFIMKIRGTFQENLTDDHVLLRNSLLNSGEGIQEIATSISLDSFADIESKFNPLLQKMKKEGFLNVQLDQPLSNDDFLSLGRLLGSLIPEPYWDEQVFPYIEDEFILNVRSNHTETINVNLQPFATNYLSLHTECSRRPIDEQPSYIVLMCCTPGSPDTQADTILVPMKEVFANLSDDVKEILANTRYNDTSGIPSFLRLHQSNPIFSFRDFQQTDMDWHYSGSYSEAKVNQAILELLINMYNPKFTQKISWKTGLLCIIDNRHFFHGKTSGRGQPLNSGNRHLKRLRIL